MTITDEDVSRPDVAGRVSEPVPGLEPPEEPVVVDPVEPVDPARWPPWDNWQHWPIWQWWRTRKTWENLQSPLQLRAVRLYLLVTAIMLMIVTLGVDYVLRARVNGGITDTLETYTAELDLLVSSATAGDGGAASGQELVDAVAAYIDGQILTDGEVLFCLLDGEVAHGSPRAVGAALAPVLATDLTGVGLDASSGTVSVLDTQYRWSARPVTDDVVFVIAVDQGHELDEVTQATVITTIGSALVLLLGAAAYWLVLGWVISPIAELTRTASRVTHYNLSERAKLVGPDELANLSGEINEMLDRLARAFAEERSFLQDVGHELRTPITIIRGHLETLDADPQPDKAIELCLDELGRMGRDVEHLLLLAKAKRPDFLLERQVDLVELTDEMFTRACALSSDHRWELRTTAEGPLVCDAHRLHQAMANLAGNAVIYSPAGTTIAIGTWVLPDSIRFYVSDEGSGVDDDTREQLFRRFGRSRTPRSVSTRPGSGLGLAIVKAIVDAHAGEVDCGTNRAGGAIFTFTVPRWRQVSGPAKPSRVVEEPPWSLEP